MPKQSTERTSRRSAPYNLSVSTTMPGQLYMPLVATAPSDWHISYDHVQHNMMPLQDVMNPLPPVPNHQQHQQSPYLAHHHQQQQQQQQQHHHQPHQQQQQQHPQHHRQSHERHEPPPTPTFQHAQSGPWSAHDDEVLVRARTMNMAWNAIHERHFPTKTSNACRKRYERLMLKRRGNDWDEDRTAKLAIAYKDMREQTWSPLADQLGERWEHVEKACMEKGLRNILNLASSHSRTNSNRHSKISNGSETDQYLRDRSEREDSGIAFAAGESSSRRSSHSNGGAMPTFHQILQHPRHQ